MGNATDLHGLLPPAQLSHRTSMTPCLSKVALHWWEGTSHARRMHRQQVSSVEDGATSGHRGANGGLEHGQPLRNPGFFSHLRRLPLLLAINTRKGQSRGTFGWLKVYVCLAKDGVSARKIKSKENFLCKQRQDIINDVDHHFTRTRNATPAPT